MEHIIQNRLTALRARMKERKIDAYLIPTDDDHSSEYVGEHFKCREYMTGFTGSAGTAVVCADMAGLWTDGRYFLQAERQLDKSGVTLYKMGQPGVPTVEVFLADHLQEGQRLGFDGRVVSAAEAEQLAGRLKDRQVAIVCDVDLVGEIWEDRPALSCAAVRELPERLTGKSRAEKCREIRRAMKDKKADVFVLSSLDDIAWLLNLRGGDVACTPVVLAYLAMTQEEIVLFADSRAFPEKLRDSLAADGVELRPYEEVYGYVAAMRPPGSVLLCKAKTNYRLAGLVPEGVTLLDEENLTLLPKAIKNPVEVENERIAHLKDGVAVTKFLFWLKHRVGQETITERSAAEHLYRLRSAQEHFEGNSFEPIIAFGAHGAIVHYSATEESDVPLEPRGLLLADTGGHYAEGTTDITRTVALGPVTEEEKQYFTAVLRGALNLAAVKFVHGCTGLNFDVLARGPLWELGKDYNHGTGHGVGYGLNVHEGPNHFGWRGESAVFEEGMITSDEPGYYEEGKFGIRHENLLVCRKAEKTEYGQFLCFEYLTLVPFDLDAVIPEQMTQRERGLLNRYHATVFEKLAPHLDPEEQDWLRRATRPV